MKKLNSCAFPSHLRPGITNAVSQALFAVCILFVFHSSESEAAFRRRLSSFSVPRQQFFFNGPQRFNPIFRRGVNPFAQNVNLNNLNAVGGLASSRFSQLTGNGSFFNNANLVDVRQADPIPNFSKIKKLGNDLIEVDQFGIGQRLFIDGNGNLIGGAKPPEARTTQQIKEFYLENRDKFNGNAKVLVDRFLAKQGALSNGLFKIDLDDFAVDFESAPMKEILAKNFKGNKALMRRTLGLAALNYLLNTLQLRTKFKIEDKDVRSDGTVTLNLAPFFRGEALAQFNIADNTSQCTGKIRLNRLIDFTMNADIYPKILNVPKTEQELANIFGFEYDKTQTIPKNKIIVGLNSKGVKESLPTKTSQRVLEWQRSATIPGSFCFRSFDTFDQVPAGTQSDARSVKTEGINFVYDGTEGLCLGGNGFMYGYAANQAGQILNRVPASIATGGPILGPEIKSVLSCLECHADGFRGGAISEMTKEPFTEHFEDVPERQSVFRDRITGFQRKHRDFFTRNPEYLKKAEEASKIFAAARRETGSEFLGPKGTLLAGLKKNESFPTLPRIQQFTNNNLTPSNAAVELGMGDSPRAAAQAEKLIGGKFITRTDFEAKYCNLIRGRNDFLNEAQQQEGLIREQIRGGGFGFPIHLR